MQYLIEQNISDYINKYAEKIEKDPALYEVDEGYKYKAVATFQKEFDLDARALPEMLERAFSDSHNLVQSGQYFPRKMLILYAKKNSAVVRTALKELYQENTSIAARVDRFLDTMEAEFSSPNKQSYFDCRFVSFLLAAREPDKYHYVKVSEYRDFAKKVKYDLKLEGSQGKKFEEMAKLAILTKGLLGRSSEFRKAHALSTSSFAYKDTSMSWGTFDFIFNIARRFNVDIDKIVQRKIGWNDDVSKIRREVLEDLIVGDQEVDFVAGLSPEELLKQAKEYKPPKEAPGAKWTISKARQDNARQKERIKRIEKYRCQVCCYTFEYVNCEGKLRGYAEVDHILEKSKGGTEAYDNLWVLCANCHMKKTLGVIVIDPVNKLVTDGGVAVAIRDNHLNWSIL